MIGPSYATCTWAAQSSLTRHLMLTLYGFKKPTRVTYLSGISMIGKNTLVQSNHAKNEVTLAIC